MYTKFIAMPCFTGHPQLLINYLDILTYFTIRTFMNDGDTSTPILTYEMISVSMESPENVVKTAVKNMTLTGLIVERKTSGGSVFDIVDLQILKLMVPASILATELTYQEKAILLILKCSCLENDVDVLISIKEIGKRFGISVKDAFELVLSIENKGYVKIANGKSENFFLQLGGRIDWKCSANDDIYELYRECSTELKDNL